MTYDEALTYIHAARRPPGEPRGLHRIRALLAELGNPQDALKIIHVAGTNGKGSVCAMLEAMLRTQYKTGLYTSPFLQHFTERFRVNGQNIPPDTLAEIVEKIKNADEKIGWHSLPFVCNTAIALLWFAQENVDYAVIECGIGGLHDCTNIVMPVLSVITRIGLDHMGILGSTVEEIAFQKAGIIKENVPVVIGRQTPEARAVLLAGAREKNSAVTDIGEMEIVVGEGGFDGNVFEINGSNVQLQTALAGRFQIENAATAWCAAMRLGLDIDSAKEGLKSAKWPGRLEYFPGSPDIIIDGAHNEQAAAALADALLELGIKREKTVCICGVLNHDASAMAKHFARFARQIIATKPDSPRVTEPADLAKCFEPHIPNEAINIQESPRKALDLAKQLAGPEGLVVVCGSLYLAGEIRSLI